VGIAAANKVADAWLMKSLRFITLILAPDCLTLHLQLANHWPPDRIVAVPFDWVKSYISFRKLA
jgi:hypothetical protein